MEALVKLGEKKLYRSMRAPNADNDRGGANGTSHASRWREAGLHCMDTVPGSCRIDASEPSRVRARWRMEPIAITSEGQAEAEVCPPHLAPLGNRMIA